jgi:anaerobic selenocysteine-containing dehydrogenase
VYICPDVNYGNAVHSDKWIPIRPNSDAALQLAIAYVWITEGTYDKKYVATHAVGFDKFEKYILGKEDGIPKTPKWAQDIILQKADKNWIELMQSIKKTLDPKNIMNPGRWGMD